MTLTSFATSEISRTYQHYKGALYEVLGTARHSKSLDELVIYLPLAKDYMTAERVVWARPLSMFIEQVTHNGQRVPRFKKVSSDCANEDFAQPSN